MPDKSTFRLGELYCGPGGLACGALRSTSADGSLSVVHAWANDYDADTCETYRKNICPDAPETVIHGDVRDLVIPELGGIDAFAYGFPCNSFSQVGEHQGIANEKFGQLYWYGVEVLRYYKPQWFIAENVSGIRSAGSGDFKLIMKDLEESGNKALHSAESNSILGEWIRQEMHVPSGTYITKQMLENYGKTKVTFRKYEDGTYLLDF